MGKLGKPEKKRLPAAPVELSTARHKLLRRQIRVSLNEMNSALMGGKYLDIHAWCFVPSSFRLIINDLYDLKLIPFREVGFYPTNGHEFYVAIGRNGDGIHETRLDMLKYIEHEIAVGNGPEADL